MKFGSTFRSIGATLSAVLIRQGVLKMTIADRLFLDHPASVNETYGQHLATASGFGGRMILAGFACLIHGLLPCCFGHTASDQIRTLHREMESRRGHRPAIDLDAGVVSQG